MQSFSNNLTYFTDSITKYLTEMGYGYLKSKTLSTRLFYKDVGNVIQLIRYSKHSKLELINLEFGIIYKDFENIKRAPQDVLKWHLRSSYGTLSPKYLGGIYYNINSKDFNDQVEELIFDMNDHLLCYLDKISNLDYMKKKFPHDFDFDKISVNNLEMFNRLSLFFGNDPWLPSWGENKKKH